MGWYVFALVDEAPSGGSKRGLSGPLAVRRFGSTLAVVERRADVPPAEFGTLQRHQAVVKSLAARVPSILPVRFGTLLDTEALEEALGEREDDVADALDIVRGRVQFTWRRRTGRGSRASKGSRTSKASQVLDGPGLSGSEYLRRASLASRPAPPAAWRPVRTKLAPLVAVERYQPASAGIPDSLYHLVPRGATRRYAAMASALREAHPLFTTTGPWPPFAFAPELL